MGDGAQPLPVRTSLPRDPRRVGQPGASARMSVSPAPADEGLEPGDRVRVPSRGEDCTVHDYSIKVPGLPPAKNEAKSMLASGHGHSERVLALLKAVQSAVEGTTIPFPEESLALELVVTSPTAPPSDATNYLGGVADVLEDKTHRGDLSHLGSVAHVALYGNDRQLHEVSFRWEAGREVGYRLRVRPR